LTSFCVSAALGAEQIRCESFTDEQVQQLNSVLHAYEEGRLDFTLLLEKYKNDDHQMSFILYVMLLSSEMKRDEVDAKVGFSTEEYLKNVVNYVFHRYIIDVTTRIRAH
jgi:hypothetical protein